VAITSRQNPIVARYRAAARGEAGTTLLLDGAHLVADAIRSGVVVQHAAVTDAAREQTDVREIVAALGRAGVNVALVSASVIDAISPVRSSTGIVALAERPAASVSRIFDGAAPLVVIGIDIQDPGNVGAMVRVAEAGGATGVIAAGASADPFGWKALRGSMGSALRLPLAILTASEAVEEARRRGCRLLATAPRGGRSLFDADLTGPLAVLIGGEGRGLEPSLVAAADDRITIPMQPPVESLNAATTAALIVYEARRQRR
jgi:TrmH family RNA methyltransferase